MTNSGCTRREKRLRYVVLLVPDMSLIPAQTYVLAVSKQNFRKFNQSNVFTRKMACYLASRSVKPGLNSYNLGGRLAWLSHLAESVKLELNNLGSDDLPFAKMQALGNDFVVLDGERLLEVPTARKVLENWQKLSPKLACLLLSRHTGIGGDGLILAMNLKNKHLLELARQIYGPGVESCQLAWTYTNSDGSFAETCGNGLRCLALWAHNKGLLADRGKVMTATGPVEIVFSSADQITADLGAPSLAAQAIPFTGVQPGQQVISDKLDIAGRSITVTLVNMGNPHCLIFGGDFLKDITLELPLCDENGLKDLPPALAKLAAEIQADPRFPASTNVSFVIKSDRSSARAVVWERGCGPTLACGSAAAAILVGGVLEKRLERQATITLPGGSLSVEWSSQDNHVCIKGPARFVFAGEFTLSTSLFEDLIAKTPLGAAPR